MTIQHDQLIIQYNLFNQQSKFIWNNKNLILKKLSNLKSSFDLIEQNQNSQRNDNQYDSFLDGLRSKKIYLSQSNLKPYENQTKTPKLKTNKTMVNINYQSNHFQRKLIESPVIKPKELKKSSFHSAKYNNFFNHRFQQNHHIISDQSLSENQVTQNIDELIQEQNPLNYINKNSDNKFNQKNHSLESQKKKIVEDKKQIENYQSFKNHLSDYNLSTQNFEKTQIRQKTMTFTESLDMQMRIANFFQIRYRFLKYKKTKRIIEQSQKIMPSYFNNQIINLHNFQKKVDQQLRKISFQKFQKQIYFLQDYFCYHYYKKFKKYIIQNQIEFKFTIFQKINKFSRYYTKLFNQLQNDTLKSHYENLAIINQNQIQRNKSLKFLLNNYFNIYKQNDIISKIFTNQKKNIFLLIQNFRTQKYKIKYFYKENNFKFIKARIKLIILRFKRKKIDTQKRIRQKKLQGIKYFILNLFFVFQKQILVDLKFAFQNLSKFDIKNPKQLISSSDDIKYQQNQISKEQEKSTIYLQQRLQFLQFQKEQSFIQRQYYKIHKYIKENAKNIHLKLDMIIYQMNRQFEQKKKKDYSKYNIKINKIKQKYFNLLQIQLEEAKLFSIKEKQEEQIVESYRINEQQENQEQEQNFHKEINDQNIIDQKNNFEINQNSNQDNHDIDKNSDIDSNNQADYNPDLVHPITQKIKFQDQAIEDVQEQKQLQCLNIQTHQDKNRDSKLSDIKQEVSEQNSINYDRQKELDPIESYNQYEKQIILIQNTYKKKLNSQNKSPEIQKQVQNDIDDKIDQTKKYESKSPSQNDQNIQQQPEFENQAINIDINSITNQRDISKKKLLKQQQIKSDYLISQKQDGMQDKLKSKSQQFSQIQVEKEIKFYLPKQIIPRKYNLLIIYKIIKGLSKFIQKFLEKKRQNQDQSIKECQDDILIYQKRKLSSNRYQKYHQKYNEQNVQSQNLLTSLPLQGKYESSSKQFTFNNLNSGFNSNQDINRVFFEQQVQININPTIEENEPKLSSNIKNENQDLIDNVIDHNTLYQMKHSDVNIRKINKLQKLNDLKVNKNMLENKFHDDPIINKVNHIQQIENYVKQNSFQKFSYIIKELDNDLQKHKNQNAQELLELEKCSCYIESTKDQIEKYQILKNQILKNHSQLNYSEEIEQIKLFKQDSLEKYNKYIKAINRIHSRQQLQNMRIINKQILNKENLSKKLDMKQDFQIQHDYEFKDNKEIQDACINVFGVNKAKSKFKRSLPKNQSNEHKIDQNENLKEQPFQINLNIQKSNFFEQFAMTKSIDINDNKIIHQDPNPQLVNTKLNSQHKQINFQKNKISQEYLEDQMIASNRIESQQIKNDLKQF